MTTASFLIPIDLTDGEETLLRTSLSAWGAVARYTENMAIAMGFSSCEELYARGKILAEGVVEGRLSGDDWLRALAATEVCFASRMNGCATELSVLSGQGDVDALLRLRAVQRKLRDLVWAGYGRDVCWHKHRPDRRRGLMTPEEEKASENAWILEDLRTRALAGDTPTQLVDRLKQALKVDRLNHAQFVRFFGRTFSLPPPLRDAVSAWSEFGDDGPMSDATVDMLLGPWMTIWKVRTERRERLRRWRR